MVSVPRPEYTLSKPSDAKSCANSFRHYYSVVSAIPAVHISSTNRAPPTPEVLARPFAPAGLREVWREPPGGCSRPASCRR
jgi:hypothetical protein